MVSATPQARHENAGLDLSSGDFATAAASCRTLIGNAPDDYQAWFNLGVFEQRNGNPAAAVEAFVEAARLQPSDAAPLKALGQSYHLMGELAAAENTYAAALALEPDSPDLIWNLGLVQEQRGDLAAAARKYSRLVKADRDSGEAWFRLGLVCLRLEDYAGAVVAFRKALERGIRIFESNYNLGLAYWEQDRVHQAADCFQAALKMQTAFRPAQRALAAIALRYGDYSTALDLHRQLIESGDGSIEVLFNLALLEHRANCLPSAIEFYQRALKIDPHFTGASTGLALAQRKLATRRN